MTIANKRADRVLLYNISWEQFENLLKDLGEHRAARVAYDNGTLEIMTPLPEHEYYKEVISDLTKDIAQELERDYESFGSTTWKREIRMAGLEPDNCFYFQNVDAVRGRLDVNLTQDPPPFGFAVAHGGNPQDRAVSPDLALEIDVTSKSLNRFPIYARLGVPELWCYDSGELNIYHLHGSEYIEAKISLVFPNLPIKELPQLIEENRAAGRLAIRRAVRQWVREKVKGN